MSDQSLEAGLAEFGVTARHIHETPYLNLYDATNNLPLGSATVVQTQALLALLRRIRPEAPSPLVRARSRSSRSLRGRRLSSESGGFQIP